MKEKQESDIIPDEYCEEFNSRLFIPLIVGGMLAVSKTDGTISEYRIPPLENLDQLKNGISLSVE